MAHVLPSKQRGHVRQQGLSGTYLAAPPSPNRASLSPTVVNYWSSRKESSNRSKRSNLDGLAYRLKCEKVSAREENTHVYHPKQQDSVNHRPNNGLRSAKPSITGAGTGNYTLDACQGSKPALSTVAFAQPPSPPQPDTRISQSSPNSITKANQLLATESSKGSSTFPTNVPSRIVRKHAAAGRPKQNGRRISRDSAIPISLGDVLLRTGHPPDTTTSEGACGKANRPVLENLFDIVDKNINVLDVDEPGLSLEGPRTADASVQGPETLITSIKEADYEKTSDSDPKDFSDEKNAGNKNDYNSGHSLDGASPLERNGYRSPQSPAITHPLLDTPESGTSQSTGDGSFMALVCSGTPSFEGRRRSLSSGRVSQKRDQSTFVVGSSKDPPVMKFSPLCLMCWYAAKGYPCCNGKGYGSPEVRRLQSDHFKSKKSPNHHLLFAECDRCERLFADKSSWEEHKKQLKSDSPCMQLSSDDLSKENYEPNQRGISEARMDKVDKAIEQYKKDGILPSGCTKDQHDEWINANYELYIGKSSITILEARKELGKWLVGWYAMFPGENIPSNPFTKNNAESLVHQQFISLVQRGLAKHSEIGSLPPLNGDHYSIIARVCGDALGILELLQQIETSQSPKAKRRKVRSSRAAQTRPGYTIGQELQPPPNPVDFAASSTLYEGSNFGGSGYTETISFNDACVDPKILEKDRQVNERRPETNPHDLSNLGAHFDDQTSSQDGVVDSNSITLGGHLGPIQQFNRNHQLHQGY